MKTYYIIGSIDIKGKIVIERAETCSHKQQRIKPQQCGFNKQQCSRLAEIEQEMKQFSTTC